MPKKALLLLMIHTGLYDIPYFVSTMGDHKKIEVSVIPKQML
jgi:hypothetical protein